MSGEGLSARHRGEHVAPWLVMLSEHMPEIDEIGGVSTLGCSCGATRTLYVGHIAGVIADRAARRESEAAEKARASSDPIIRYADLGDGPEFDEFIAHNATVHVEAMGRTSWWIGVDLPDGRTWHINLGAMNERAKFYARCDDVTCYPRADSVAQGREEGRDGV